MAYLYDPGIYMPTSEDGFDEMCWIMSWPDGPWHLHDMEVGGTVLLVDVDAQRIIWETRVTYAFMVPYEANLDLGTEIARRWGLQATVSGLTPGGFATGWRAEPVRRLDRRPVPNVRQVPSDDDVLELTGEQQSAHMSPAFIERWAIAPEPEVFCSGQPTIGWFGPGHER